MFYIFVMNHIYRARKRHNKSIGTSKAAALPISETI